MLKTLLLPVCALSIAKAQPNNDFCKPSKPSDGSRCDFDLICDRVCESGGDNALILNSWINSFANSSKLCVQLDGCHIPELRKGFISNPNCFKEDGRCVVDLKLRDDDIARIDSQAFFQDTDQAEQFESLSLSQNFQLSAFEFGDLFARFPNLVELDLSSIGLATFPQALPPNLEHFNMMGNKLINFDNFSLPNCLKSLNLSSNSIGNWQALEPKLHLENLTQLDLSENGITSPNLEELYKLMPNLAWIGLRGNPLECDENLCFLQDQMLNLVLDHDNPVCQGPDSAKGTRLTDANLNCPATSSNSLSIIAISVSIAVLFFLGMVALGLLYLQKHGRLLFVRRQQRKAEDYVYDGPGIDTFELEDSQF